MLKCKHIKSVMKIHVFYVQKTFDTIKLIEIINYEHFCPYLDENRSFEPDSVHIRSEKID